MNESEDLIVVKKHTSKLLCDIVHGCLLITVLQSDNIYTIKKKKKNTKDETTMNMIEGPNLSQLKQLTRLFEVTKQ